MNNYARIKYILKHTHTHTHHATQETWFEHDYYWKEIFCRRIDKFYNQTIFHQKIQFNSLSCCLLKELMLTKNKYRSMIESCYKRAESDVYLTYVVSWQTCVRVVLLIHAIIFIIRWRWLEIYTLTCSIHFRKKSKPTTQNSDRPIFSNNGLINAVAYIVCTWPIDT